MKQTEVNKVVLTSPEIADLIVKGIHEQSKGPFGQIMDTKLVYLSQQDPKDRWNWIKKYVESKLNEL